MRDIALCGAEEAEEPNMFDEKSIKIIIINCRNCQ